MYVLHFARNFACFVCVYPWHLIPSSIFRGLVLLWTVSKRNTKKTAKTDFRVLHDAHHARGAFIHNVKYWNFFLHAGTRGKWCRLREKSGPFRRWWEIQTVLSSFFLSQLKAFFPYWFYSLTRNRFIITHLAARMEMQAQWKTHGPTFHSTKLTLSLISYHKYHDRGRSRNSVYPG